MQLSDIDLRIILGYLSDDRSQMLPGRLRYRSISVTYQRHAAIEALSAEPITELEEIKRRHNSKGNLDYNSFIAEGTKYIAEHPEYVDEMIHRMRLNGVRDPDESR